MELYHGSNMVVSAPRILEPTHTLDFGPGFYTTLNRDQAAAFAAKVVDRARTGVATLNVYAFDETEAFRQCCVLRFDGPDGRWLDFVAAHRRGTPSSGSYDLVFGPVANDNVYRTLGLFMAGVLDRDQTLVALKARPLFNQMVFATPKALSFLRFVRKEDVR